MINSKLLVYLFLLFSLFLPSEKQQASGESAWPVNEVPGQVESAARRLANSLKGRK